MPVKTFAESATPYIIMVAGTISNGERRVGASKSNKSLIVVAAPPSSMASFLEISNSNNIIIQNRRSR